MAGKLVISEWELWAVTNRVMQQHGAGAADHALLRARELEAAGDEAGAGTWERVLERIGELQRRPSAGDVVQ